MFEFDRRTLLAAGFAAIGTNALGASRKTVEASLTPHPGEELNDIPLDYNGFSVETAQFADPSFCDAGNTSLVALHRRLSANAVLRVGGNSSEFCWWKTSPEAQPPVSTAPGMGRADNTMPQRFTPITPPAVDNLRGFLDACGWTCIWGLNFGTGSPDRDAEEAAYVARALGPKLLYFQIGNEPDLYKTPNNLLRPAGWDFADYLNEWTAIANAVSQRVPGAKFGGPDVGTSADWVVRFAQEAPSAWARASWRSAVITMPKAHPLRPTPRSKTCSSPIRASPSRWTRSCPWHGLPVSPSAWPRATAVTAAVSPA